MPSRRVPIHRRYVPSVADRSDDRLPVCLAERRWVGRAIALAAAVLAANALVGERGLGDTLRARADFSKAVADLSQMQYENAALAQQVEQLRRDRATIEKIARGELGLIRPGEVLVVVQEVDAADPSSLTGAARSR